MAVTRALRPRAAALALFVALVALGWLHSIDHRLAGWIVLFRSPALDGPMRTVSWFGDPQRIALILTGIALALWRIEGRRAALALAAAFFIGFFSEIVLRLVVLQWRPETLVVPPSPDLWLRFQLSGFPSGHGLHSAFLFGWIADRLEHRGEWARLGRLACALIVLAVGVSRLYLNRHWASDVVGGWLLASCVLPLTRERESQTLDTRP